MAKMAKKKKAKAVHGYGYRAVHTCFVILVAMCTCFVTDVRYLALMLLIIGFTFASNVVCQNCPLTILEEQCVGSSVAQGYRSTLQKAGIGFASARTYEQQLVTLVTTFSFIAMKTMALFLWRTWQHTLGGP
jgi:hypothetical protein